MTPRSVVLAALALACSGGDLVLPEDDSRPVALAIAGGDKQTGAVGGPLADPLVVKVTDALGRPVAGVPVAWSASAGGVDPASSVTDADGRASTRRILGDELGAQSATATSPGLEGSPARFRHTAVAGSATRLVKVAGDGQTAAPGAPLPAAIVVRLLDAADTPIAGHAVTWLVTSGGGTISPREGTTDTEGRSSARWTLGPSAGRQTATAVVSGVGVVEFTATATSSGGNGKGGKGGGKDDASGIPARVAIWQGDGQTARVGAAVKVDPAVLVTNAAGRGVKGIRVDFAVIDGGGSVTGARPTTDASGIAVAGGWMLGRRAGTNRLRATVQGSGIAGNPAIFTATATKDPHDVDRLVFRVQPSRTPEGKRIEPAVQVAVVAGGAVQSSRQGEVQLELRGGDDRARLHGDLRRVLSSGIATFTNLRIDRAGRAYRLRASAGGVASVDSDPFDIADD